MLLHNKLCADVGTVNCPCYLAEYGKCIVCSRLGGSVMPGPGGSGCLRAGTDSCCETVKTCDCGWHGVCIYNEYLQNNLCIKERTDYRETGAGRNGCGEHGKRNDSLQNGCGEQRQSRLCKIQQIKWFEDDLAVLRIGVPKGMAEKAALPGSFVFVRAADKNSVGAGDGRFTGNCEVEKYFEFPVSVMHADYENSAIELAVKTNGPKSRALLQGCTGDHKKSSIDDGVQKVREVEWQDWDNGTLGYVELRGIYRNGLLGVEKLQKSAPLRVLCLTKGIGIAPVSNYIRWVSSVGDSGIGGSAENKAGLPDVAEAGVQIDVIADLDKINREFADYALGIADSGGKDDEICEIENTGGAGAGLNRLNGLRSAVYSPLPLNLSWAQQEKYDVIVISASEYYQQNIYVPETKKVLSNNTSMCCGEGVCGACTCVDGNGTVHRMCKECGVER